MDNDIRLIETPEELIARGLRPIRGADGEPAAVVPPAFVPSDEFKAFQNTMQGAVTGLSDEIKNLAALLRPQPQRTGEPEIADATDEELEAALASGTGAAVLRKAISAGIERRIRTDMEPRMQAGLEAIATLTQNGVVARTDGEGKPLMPYYKRFEKEINAYVATMPPGTRMNEAVYQMAYAVVVGQHTHEIVAEAIEATNRAAAKPPAAQPGALRSTRQIDTTGDRVPTVSELLGEDAAMALESLGRTPDAHAQRLGYADWATYAKFTVDQEAELVGGKK